MRRYGKNFKKFDLKVSMFVVSGVFALSATSFTPIELYSIIPSNAFYLRLARCAKFAIDPSAVAPYPIISLLLFEIPTYLFFVMYMTVLYLWYLAFILFDWELPQAIHSFLLRSEVIYKFRRLKRLKVRSVMRGYVVLNLLMLLIFVVFFVLFFVIEEDPLPPCQQGKSHFYVRMSIDWFSLQFFHVSVH